MVWGMCGGGGGGGDLTRAKPGCTSMLYHDSLCIWCRIFEYSHRKENIRLIIWPIKSERPTCPSSECTETWADAIIKSQNGQEYLF
jgi:hypothetical protein